MLRTADDLLQNHVVLEGLRKAWLDSNPGISGGHGEDGFVVEDDNEDRYVIRWPAGSQDELVVPPHEGCRVNEQRIVATFHTHPNTGDHYRQEPGRVDIRAVSEDPDLKASDYVGEFVVSERWVYLIGQSGQVTQVGTRGDALGGRERF